MTLVPGEDDAFADLLLLDLALLEGKVDGRQAAMALLRAWDGKAPRRAGALAQALAESAGLAPDQVEGLRARAGELRVRHGTSRAALDARGGMDGRLRAAISRRDDKVSRSLSKLGARSRHPLRPVAPDRYVDYLPVGQGGMGVVYWALDGEMNRAVAFKVLRPPGPAADAGVTPPAPIGFHAPTGDTSERETFEAGVARFLMEAWITGGMEHPGIVPVYEIGATEHGVPYYTMRFVRGRRTLADALDEARGKPVGERLHLLEPLLKVCDAIRYAHSRGVIHRDLKPDNVALGEYGEVVVLDWGLAKLVGSVDHAATRWRQRVEQFRSVRDLRTLTSVIGTPGYLAPEAARGEIDALDERADVYALGVILHEILTGHLPLDPGRGPAYLAQVAAEAPPPVLEVEPEAPPALAALCDAALAVARDARPASVDDLAAAIRTWQRDAAAEGQVASWCREARTALSVAEDADAPLAARELERAATACNRVLELRPGHAEASELLDATRAAARKAVERAEREARRRLGRRVAAVAALALVVVASAVAWVVEGRRREAEDARRVARDAEAREALQRESAEATMRFMVDEVREQLAARAQTAELVELGRQARAHYAAQPVVGDPPARFERRIGVLLDLGRAELQRGHLPDARAAFEEAEQASATYGDAHPEHTRALLRRAEALVALAEVDHARGFAPQGRKRTDDALALLEAVARTAVDETATELRARAYATRASLLTLAGAYQDAYESAALAGGALERLDPGRESRYELRSLPVELTILRAHMSAIAPQSQGDITLADRALAEARGFASSDPEDLRARRMLARALAARAAVLLRLDRHDEAVADMEQAIAGLGELAVLRPDNLAWVGDHVALMARRIGWYEGPLGKRPEADAVQVRDGPLVAASISRLLEVDAKHGTWLNIAISSHHTMSQLAARGLPTPLPAVGYRRAAMELAARLREADPDNPRFRVIEAFTVAYSGLARDPASRGAVLDAWEHLVDVWARLPTARSEVAILERVASHALVHAQGDEALWLRVIARTNECLLHALDDAGGDELLLQTAVGSWLLERRAHLPSASPELRRVLHDDWSRALRTAALAEPPEGDDGPHAQQVRAWRAELARLLEESE
ncbi:MAG: protein kinase [Planctomycetota bacterium]